MIRPIASTLLACTLLTACASATPTVVTADVTKAEAVFADTVTAYDAAKLVAAGVAITDPTLAATLGKVEAVVDPLVMQAQAIEAAAVVDAPALEAIVAQIQGQVAGLEAPTAKSERVMGARKADISDVDVEPVAGGGCSFSRHGAHPAVDNVAIAATKAGCSLQDVVAAGR